MLIEKCRTQPGTKKIDYNILKFDCDADSYQVLDWGKSSFPGLL
jgi:hypothetical protein